VNAGPSAERERAVGGAMEEERDGEAAGAGRRALARTSAAARSAEFGFSVVGGSVS